MLLLHYNAGWSDHAFDQQQPDEQSAHRRPFDWGWRNRDRVDQAAVQPHETGALGDDRCVGDPRTVTFDWRLSSHRDGIHRVYA